MSRAGRDIIPIQLGTVPRSTHDRQDVCQRQNAFLRSRLKFRPVSHMLFRPEKMDAVSRVRPIFSPFADREINIATDFIRALRFNSAVSYLDLHRFATVQTGRVNLNCLPFEHPADRQGFKPSLGKPFLLAIDGQAILGRQIIERGKRGD